MARRWLPDMATATSLAFGARSRKVTRRSAPTSGDFTGPPPRPCCTAGAVGAAVVGRSPEFWRASTGNDVATVTTRPIAITAAREVIKVSWGSGPILAEMEPCCDKSRFVVGSSWVGYDEAAARVTNPENQSLP